MSRNALVSVVLAYHLAGSVCAQEPSAAIALTPEESYERARIYIEEQYDFMSAMPYLRPAAEAGFVRAQVWLAQYLDYGEENAEAERFYAMAVAAGDPEAKLGLAIMHIANDTGNPDLSEALRLVREAANQNFGPAIKALAAAYVSGGLGLSEEDQQSDGARHWIERAAALDDVVALRKLEESYRAGGLGLAVDTAKADELRSRIAVLTGVVEKDESGRRRRKQ